MTTRPPETPREQEFAAKLLFQFRVVDQDVSNKRRLCEERIVRLVAQSEKSALALANRKGRAAQHNYLNSAGGTVFFEFVGVMDLRQLGPECDEDEVWYELTQRFLPMERKDRFIPARFRV